jgi:hypothetical protein
MVRWFSVLALLIFSTAASAEVVYPPGSRIGLEPPPEMALSSRFAGFENSEKQTSITIMELPAVAYNQAMADLSKQELKRQNVKEISRQIFKIGDRDALLVSGEQVADGQKIRKWIMVFGDDETTGFIIGQAPQEKDSYSNSQIIAALKTVTLRPPLTLEQQAESLPFSIGDLAGFRIVRVISGNSIILTDGPKDTNLDGEQPVVVIGVSMGAPPDDKNRETFARQALMSSQNLRNVMTERSESFHIKGDDWHEVVARAVDTISSRPVVVMQTIRFHGNGYVRMLAIVKEEARTGTLTRFLRIIDSVDFKES